MIKLNSTLLCDILIDFNSGNILWGLLRLNEYTSPDSLLRKATLQKYKEEILAYKASVALTEKLIDGFILKDLSCDEQFIIKSLSRNKRKEEKYNFKVVNKNEDKHTLSCNRLKRRIN